MLTTFILLAAGVRGPGDVAAMTAASDAVVRAQVVRQSSAFGAGGGQIFTTVVMRPLETWKGEPGQAEIRVLVPGGEAEGLSQITQGAAVFKDGEEVVVFLDRRAAGVYSIHKLALGKFAVGAPAGLPKRALRDRSGLECQGCSAAESDDLTLDELRARVLESARK